MHAINEVSISYKGFKDMTEILVVLFFLGGGGGAQTGQKLDAPE